MNNSVERRIDQRRSGEDRRQRQLAALLSQAADTLEEAAKEAVKKGYDGYPEELESLALEIRILRDSGP